VLGTIGSKLGYRDLIPHTIEMEIGDGLRVHVLDLETIVALKEALAGEKDRAVLPSFGAPSKKTKRQAKRADA
jgi:hypothetical protein